MIIEHGIRFNPLTIALMAALIACIAFLTNGCSHLTVSNQTQDGRIFKASAWSFLWDRNLGGLQFDYEKGTLEVLDLKSTPDKETIAKGVEMIGAALEVMKAVAK